MIKQTCFNLGQGEIWWCLVLGQYGKKAVDKENFLLSPTAALYQRGREEEQFTVIGGDVGGDTVSKET